MLHPESLELRVIITVMVLEMKSPRGTTLVALRTVTPVRLLAH